MNILLKDLNKTNLDDYTILIVDDNPSNLSVITDCLDDAGFTVIVSQDGESGLSRARYAKPDIILLDVMMPGIDGFETCRQLKKDKMTKDIPVIFMTVLTETKDKLKGFQAGAVDYVSKPVQTGELIARIATHLRLKELNEGLEEQVAQRTEELYQTTLKLKDSNRLLNAVMKGTTDAIFIKDIEGRYLMANDATCKAIGKPYDDIIGKKDSQLFPKKSSEIINAVDQQVLQSKQPVIVDEFLQTAYGDTYWLVNKSPYLDEEGNIKGLIGISRNITEFKQIEKEKSRLQKQLLQSQKIESIGTLTGGVAHDFNNILNVIIGNTELSLEDIPIFHPAYSLIAEIKKAAIKATSIIKQLLSFSRNADPEMKPIDIVFVISDTLKMLRSIIPTTIDIQKKFLINSQTIMADPVQINQIVMNLCINAHHSMEKDGGIIEIYIKNITIDKANSDWPDVSSGRYVNVIISDTGPGMNQAILDKIFDPYFTTKEVGKGSGLGLAVVHGIVKSHKGSISVESQPGKGTSFSIIFPISEKKVEEPPKVNEKASGGNEKILFVDDDPAIAQMIKKSLERINYSVEIHTNPLDAIKTIQEKPDYFDLVITDMTMPHMTGIELFEKIKKIQSELPVIICTGHSSIIDESQAKKIGIDAFIMKPISRNKLAKCIRKVLNNK